MLSKKSPTALLAFAFRPFFLLSAAYAACIILGWSLLLFAGTALPFSWPALQWHSHEMLFGFVTAAIAGFLLTAMTNWTGAAPLQGKALLALVLLWISGRVVMWLSAALPWLVVALVDLAFLPVLAIYVARILLRHQNRKNLILVLILSLLFIANLLMHLGQLQLAPWLMRQGELLGLNLITLIMVVIAGRITPAFTANWLRMHGGDPARVIRSARMDLLAIASIALLIPLNLGGAPGSVVAVFALAAGVFNGIRLLQWRGWQVNKEPLLWILHLGYLWIVIALFLRGTGLLLPGLSDSLWQHALGVGAMGTLILGVMTRVAMGHTGRALQLVRFGLLIYIAIILSGLFRMLAAAQLIDYTTGVLLSAVFWITAFVLFVVLYWPILSRPRADGRPG